MVFQKMKNPQDEFPEDLSKDATDLLLNMLNFDS